MKKLLIIIGITVGLYTSIVADPIHDAAASGDIATVQAELDKGVDVDAGNGLGDRGGITPLYLAAQSGHKKIVELLIEKGADLEAKNYFTGRNASKNGRTAVFAAINSKELMTILIAGGADLNATADSLRETVLHILARQSQSESIMELIELVINNGGNMNQLTTLYASKNTTHAGMGTPTDIALFEKNFEIANLIRKYGGKTTGEVIASLQNKTVALEKLISDKHKADTPNPTDEWPRKMWEINLESEISDVMSHPYLKQGFDNNAVIAEVSFTGGLRTAYWITRDGSFYEIKGIRLLSKYIIHLDDNNLIYYSASGNYPEETYTVNYLQKKDNEVVTAQFTRRNITSKGFGRSSAAKIHAHNDNQGFTVQISWEGSKLTAWDFTPPTSTAANPDGGNNGDNDTANSRLIIKTDGPDITLATDGALGAAELQKSDDLRSWRKLKDVPKEAAEVLITPSESGNEFYRLKKN